jgi:hypothetical protein
MYSERPGHSGLDDQPFGVQVEHRVFCPPSHIANGLAGQTAGELSPGNSPEHIIVTQAGAHDPPPNHEWLKISNNGFDFGELRHSDVVPLRR